MTQPPADPAGPTDRLMTPERTEELEAWLRDEPQLSEEEALEAEFAEEDTRLRLQMASWIGVAVVVLTIFLAPFIASLGIVSSGPWNVFVWAVVNLPLLTLAVITWRRGRITLGNGKVLEGGAARGAAAVIVLVTALWFLLGVVR